jgi:ankyrin repeat protein
MALSIHEITRLGTPKQVLQAILADKKLAHRKNIDGHTALMVAIASDNAMAVKVLLPFSALNAMDKKGRGLTELAASRSAAVRSLVEAALSKEVA